MSVPNELRFHRVGALCLIVVCFAAVGQTSRQSLSFNADSVSLGADNSVFNDITITDGRVSIEAGEGRITGDQTAEGSWELSDGVRIAIDSARLSGAAATFRYSEGRFTVGEITGDPVMFETSPGPGVAPIRGTAGTISYDRAQGLLSATGDASFSRGAQEVDCDWTFNLQDGTASGIGEGDEKCHVRIPIHRER